MAIENIEGILSRLRSSLDEFVANVEDILDESFEPEEGMTLAEEVRLLDSIVVKVDTITGGLYNHYNEIVSTLGEITAPLREELRDVRQRYLEEETDTPREAAENIKSAMERINMSDEDRGLMQSALKFLKTLVPPTVEEVEEIPFETARVDDSNLPVGTEVIEREGIKGKLKVTYEIHKEGEEENLVEIDREVVEEPVMQVIRVGTKVDEAQQ